MKALTPETLQRALRDGRRGGSFLVFGDEQYLKEEAVNALVDAHLDPATRDFNFDRLNAGQTTPETIAAVAATPPLMAEWRVVLIEDVQAVATSARARSTLEAVLGRRVPGLLLIATAQVPSGRTAQFYENLKKLGTVVECATLSDADLPGWLMERSSALGVTLDPDAARALTGAIGAETGVLLQELKKLVEFVGQRGTITRDDVRSVVGSIARVSRWEWFDMVSDRKFVEARNLLPALLDAGETGVGLVIGLGTQFLRVAIGAAGGQPALDRALPPQQKWLASRVARQARGWSSAGLDLVLADLLRADRLLKSTNLSDTQVLEELLLRLQTRVSSVAA
ncbi:MAG: DNA polymerase III subunit delta [Longimicrobiales bacterium]